MKRNSFIQANINGKIETALVLYVRGKKVTAWFFNLKSDDNDPVLYILDKEHVQEVDRSAIPECDFLGKVDDYTFDVEDFVLFTLNDKQMLGRVTKITNSGYELISGRSTYTFDFYSDIKKAPRDMLKLDDECPLKDWSATIGFSKEPHHDGGYCKLITYFHKGKKVAVWEEDPMSGDVSGDSLKNINGVPALEVLSKNAKEAFIKNNMPENKMFFADAEECIGEYMLFGRGFKTLEEHFTL